MAYPKRAVSATTTVVLRAPRRPNADTKRLHRRARILMVLIVLGNLVAFGAIWSVNAYREVHTASHDLAQRLQDLTVLLPDAHAYEGRQLATIQDDLSHAVIDLGQLDSALPLHATIGTNQVKHLHQTLLMHQNFLAAQLDLATSIATMEPYLQAFALSFLGQTTSTPPLTLDTIHIAQRWLNAGYQLWQQTQQQFVTLGSQPLTGTLGIDATPLNALTTYLRDLQPRLQTTFSAASAFLDNSYLLMGIARPANIFLGVLAPDQLRPLGGIVSSAAIVQAQNGTTTHPPQFRDITAFDCSPNCTKNPIPAAYRWFTPPTGTFGLRDGGLTRDIVGAGTIEHDLLQNEQGILADAMLYITPAVWAQLLAIIGPVAIPTLNVEVNATNIADVLASIHLQALTSSAPANGAAPATQEAVVLNAILAAAQQIPPAAFGRLGQTLLQDITAKDIQIFVIYDRVQSQFAPLGVTGLSPQPNADALTIIDTDMSKTSSDNAVRETWADAILLDTTGTAHHHLTLTYTLNSARVTAITDLVQVVVPATATQTQVGGDCQSVAISEPNALVLGCRVTISAAATARLTFTWSTPLMGPAYSLIVHRQAGNSQFVSVTITAPEGKQLTPLSLTGAKNAPTQVRWAAAPLSHDAALVTAVKK